MPNNRRTKIRIRTHEITIIRLRKTKATGDPYDSTNDSDVRGGVSHSHETDHALLTGGDSQLSGGDIIETSEDREPWDANERSGRP